MIADYEIDYYYDIYVSNNYNLSITSKITGRSSNALSRWFKSAGLEMHFPRFYYKMRFSREQVAEMHNLYTNNISTLKIAEIYNIKQPHLYRLFKSYGFPIMNKKSSTFGIGRKKKTIGA